MLVKIYDEQTQNAIDKLEAMLKERGNFLKDAVIVDSNYAIYKTPVMYPYLFSDDKMIKSIREELERIKSVAIPVSYYWEEE